MPTLTVAALAAFACCGAQLPPATVGEALRAARVPVNRLSESELARKMTSHAESGGDPYLLAYYAGDESGLLRPPLHVIRCLRGRGQLDRANVASPNCLGSVIRVQPHGDRAYVTTHLTPSAVCTIVLSRRLEVEDTLNASVLAFLGDEYAILERDQIHFASVHSLEIEVRDISQRRSTPVYPYPGDAERLAFARQITPHIHSEWCGENNARCDQQNFTALIKDGVAVNEAARLFAFKAVFHPEGFGDEAQKRVASRTVAYFFCLRGGAWQHREFHASKLARLFGTTDLDSLIQSPGVIFK